MVFFSSSTVLKCEVILSNASSGKPHCYKIYHRRTVGPQLHMYSLMNQNYYSVEFDGHIVYLQPNHLIGLKQHYLRLSFLTITDLLKVRRDVMPAVKKNREQLKHNNFYTEMLTTALASKGDSGTTRKTADQMENIIDIRYLRKHCVLIIHRSVDDS